MDIGDIWRRVYTPQGKRTHLLAPQHSPNTTESALCGRSPGFGDFWWGTGSQDEYDTAKQQELCSQCTHAFEKLQESL